MPIVNLTQGTTLASEIEVADTPPKRMQGLLGRTSMKSTEALIITQCQSIHMLFMKFSIDVVFIDSKNRVVGIAERIKPFAFSPIFWKAICAIELPAGTIEQTKTQVGDLLEIK